MLSIFTGALIALELTLTVVSLNRLGYLDKFKNLFKRSNIRPYTPQQDLKVITWNI